MEGPINNNSVIFKNAIHTDVAIVGGGISGLTALKILLDLGIDAILFEAQDRVGGRIKSTKYGNSILEEGAEWIHGEDENPLYQIAKAKGELAPHFEYREWVHKVIRSDGSKDIDDHIIKEKIYNILESVDVNGILKPYYGKGYGYYFIDKLKDEQLFDQTNLILPAWSHYLQQIINSMEGTLNWNDISAFEADKYISYGADRKWKTGYNFVINHLTENISSEKILLTSPVRKIIWDRMGLDGVFIQTDSKNYLAKHVIVTTSIGYLKKNHESLFTPSLPRQLISNFEGMILGGPNKVFIGWESPWWKEKYLFLTVLWNQRDLPPEMNWLYGLTDIFSSPEFPSSLLAFVAGEYSENMEALSEKEVKEHLLIVLNKLFPDISIPNPSFLKRTTWNKNPWVCGSYSSFITNDGYKAGLANREPFRRVINNTNKKPVIFWAGEHTHDSRYGTADGAYSSGIRVANEVTEALKSNKISQEISPLNILY